jgi:zinc protease
VNRVIVFGVAIASLVLSDNATGQGLDRTKRPVAEAPAPFVFPKMETRRLGNKLQVVVIENHSLPLVSVRAVVSVDSVDDPIGKEGVYVLTAGMLREGTTTRNGDQIASDIAILGNPVTSSRFTTVPQNLAPSLEIMAGMLMHPTFPDSALKRLKTVIAGAKQRELDVPATIPSRVFLSKLFGAEHPLARTGCVTEASLKAITRDDLVQFHKLYYRPEATTLVVVGDVRTAEVIALASKIFGSWRAAGEGSDWKEPVSASAPTTIYLIDRPGAQQSIVFVGTLGPARKSPDEAALETMAPILGASGGSRLYDNLRERHGYMYVGTATAVVWPRRFIRSIIGGSVAVATAKTDSALIEWLGELRGMGQRAPTSQEMDLARGALVGALPAQMETDDLIANRLMGMLQTGVPLDFYNSYSNRIEAVTAEQVRAAAAKYIDVRHLIIVVAGDRKTVEPLLRAANIAPIVVVDDGGKS